LRMWLHFKPSFSLPPQGRSHTVHLRVDDQERRGVTQFV
jgi:hypothetical protein